MNREQFINYLLHPEDLKAENAVALNSLLKEFPYFQSAQLLYLKSLHNDKSIHYQSQLKIAAAYSANRKSLYFLINGEPKAKVIGSLATNIPVIHESEAIQALEVQSKELETKPEPVIEVVNRAVETEIRVPEQPIVAAKQNDLEVKQENTFVAPVEVKSAPADSQLEKLNTSILSEAINSEALLELNALEAIPLVPQTQITEKVLGQDSAPKIEKHTHESSETHSFLEWLKLSQSQFTNSDVEDLPQKVIKAKPDAKKVLIEKFITTEPRIVPKKQEFYNPVNKARQSVMENDSIVSETLALVYLKQGNYQRALKSYEILSLKLPEKSAYFAAQILKIKELQREKK
jgi:hypothetical protein